jgi:hypothetical protein
MAYVIFLSLLSMPLIAQNTVQLRSPDSFTWNSLMASGGSTGGSLMIEIGGKHPITIAISAKDGWHIIPNLSREDLELALQKLVTNWDQTSKSQREESVEQETRMNACVELLKGAQKTLEGILKATDSMSPRKASHL